MKNTKNLGALFLLLSVLGSSAKAGNEASLTKNPDQFSFWISQKDGKYANLNVYDAGTSTPRFTYSMQDDGYVNYCNEVKAAATMQGVKMTVVYSPANEEWSEKIACAISHDPNGHTIPVD